MSKHKRNNIYQEVTDKIITFLEAGTKPWECPWDRTGELTLPINENSQEYYKGINIPLLWMSQQSGGFSSSRWMTYKQAHAKDAQVRKGEKGTQIIFYKTLEKESIDASSLEKTVESIPMLRSFTVFNLDQIDGIDAPLPVVTGGGFDPIESAEAVLKHAGVRIDEGGTKACYYPSLDKIDLPDRERFSDAYNFYATALHELTHATQHKSRCDRKAYDSDSLKTQYAFEELVAEIGSVFAMTHLGLSGELEGHASYIDHWLDLLRNDSRAIFKASAQAQKAHDWIMSANDQSTEMVA